MDIHIRQNSTFTWRASNKFQAIYFLRHIRKTPANYEFCPKSTEMFYRKDTSFPFRQNSTPLSVERLSSFQQRKKRFLTTILHPTISLSRSDRISSPALLLNCTCLHSIFDIIRHNPTIWTGLYFLKPSIIRKNICVANLFSKKVALDFEFPVQSAQTAFSNKNFVKLLPW